MMIDGLVARPTSAWLGQNVLGQGLTPSLLAIEWEPLADVLRDHVLGILENLLRRVAGITHLRRFHDVRHHLLPPWDPEYPLHPFSIQPRIDHLFFRWSMKGDDDRAFSLLGTQVHPLSEIGHDSSEFLRSHVSPRIDSERGQGLTPFHSVDLSLQT